MYGWGNVTVEDWPSSTRSDLSLPREPEGLDQKAKGLRTQFYQRVYSLEECKRAIYSEIGVAVSLPVTEQWFDAERGEIEDIDSKSVILGMHYVSLLGYSDSLKRLQFANSWGKDWGTNGFGSLPYSYYENQSHEAWLTAIGFDSKDVAHDAIRNARIAQKPIDRVLELMWAVQDPLRSASDVHCREIYDVEHDERIGWAFATTRGGFLDVEDFFVRPAYRRRGYAARIARMLLDLSGEVGLPLRLQISHADVGAENKEALDGISRVMGLSLRSTDQRGLAYVALPGTTIKTLAPIVIPERPTLSRGTRRVAASVLASTITPGSSALVDSPVAHSSEFEEEDPVWRCEIERNSPTNEQLRAMIGKFAPPEGNFDDEEMPY